MLSSIVFSRHRMVMRTPLSRYGPCSPCSARPRGDCGEYFVHILSVTHTHITCLCGALFRTRLIVAQILGAYIGCLLIYVQYHDFIKVRGPS